MNINKAIQLVLKHYYMGELQQAEEMCRKILKNNPNDAELLYFLGIIYGQMGKDDSSMQYIKKSLQFNQNNTDAYFALGTLMKQRGLLDEAISYFQKVIDINPKYVEAYENLGNILKEKSLINEAIFIYQKAISLNTRNSDVYNNLGECLIKEWKIDDAITIYKQAIQLNPANVSAYNNLGNAFQIRGNPIEAEMYYRRAIEIDSSNNVPYQNLLFVMNYNSFHNAKKILDENLQFAKRFEEPLLASISPYNNEKSLHRRLKIGYVSPNFNAHSVSYFIEPVLSNHNKEEFEIFCYSLDSLEDEVTKRLREYANHWRNIAKISEEKAAEIIRSDNIDILIDLAGHTTNNKILLFARKPAPMQLTWIGYIATTGFSTFDYKITDNYSDPPGMSEEFYTEKLIRLPESFLCYLPVKKSPDIVKLPALTAGHITFGSFNNFVKVSHEIIAIWSKILTTIPNSRLIIKAYNFCDSTTRQYAMNMFTLRGIPADRITLESWDPSPTHLKSYNQVDIGLDTFPFNGGATTCEAIWMGVPVISLAGAAYHSRMGISLLSNIGLPELVAKTSDEYIAIATNLAKDLNKLQSLREHLRDMMKHSPLCDAKRFTTNLEMCYRTMWETWCKSI
jgi:protein O-GlcNAc transferase